MHWQSHDDQDRPLAGGTVPDVGVDPDVFREWLEGQGHTNVTITAEPLPGAPTDQPGPSSGTGEDPAAAADRRRPGAGVPPGGNGCTATEFSTAHAYTYDPGMDTDRARLEWEMCGRPDDDDIHDLTDLAELEAMAPRRSAVPPPGAQRATSTREELAGQEAAMTPEQRRLLEDVEARMGMGDDGYDVLRRAAASPADKAAVADYLGVEDDAGEEFRTRDQRMADRAAELADLRRQHRDGTIDYGEFLDRSKVLHDAQEAENTLDVQDRVAAAYEEIKKDPARGERLMPDVVGVDELRDKVGDVPKAVFDHAVQSLAAHPDAGLEPGGAKNFHAGPNEAERLAAVSFGGERGVRFRMGVNYEGNNVEAIARGLGEEGRNMGEADSILRRLGDDQVAEVAARLGVDTSDNPPAPILRERVADHADQVRDRRHTEAEQFTNDAHTLYEAEHDLDNIGEWEPERRAAVREAAERRHNTGDRYVSDRAQTLAPAVARADLADAWDRYGDFATEIEGHGDTPIPAAEAEKLEAGSRAAMFDLAAAADRVFGGTGPISDNGLDVVSRYREAKAAVAAAGGQPIPAAEAEQLEAEFERAAVELAAYSYDSYDPEEAAGRPT